MKNKIIKRLKYKMIYDIYLKIRQKKQKLIKKDK